METNQISRLLLLAVACLWGGAAQAGVIVGGTRVVYDGAKREVSLSIKNPDKTPYLIQAWADADGPTGENKTAPKPPFVVTPPVFRLDPDNENMIRIIRTGGHFPDDRESIFWMNVKSIPASAPSNKNVLQISVKTRIKLFYRPKTITAPTEDDYKKVSFRRAGNQLQVTNPTPYYLSFYSLKMGETAVKTTNMMVPPKGSVDYTLSSTASASQVTWQVINDFGGNSKTITSPLQ